MSAVVHETALIDPSAVLGEGVFVGPYSIIGPNVKIGDGTQINPHVVIRGDTEIGRDCRIYQFTTLADEPQIADLSKEERKEGRVVIGDRVEIREFCSISKGSTRRGANGLTTIGDDVKLYCRTHLGHDCQIGDRTIIVDSALAGHVQVGNDAYIGGGTVCHQFVRIGPYSFLGGGLRIGKDTLPFMITSMRSDGRVGIWGPNYKGLERKGVPKESVQRLANASRIILNGRAKRRFELLSELEAIRDNDPAMKILIDFLSVHSDRLFHA